MEDSFLLSMDDFISGFILSHLFLRLSIYRRLATLHSNDWIIPSTYSYLLLIMMIMMWHRQTLCKGITLRNLIMSATKSPPKKKNVRDYCLNWINSATWSLLTYASPGFAQSAHYLCTGGGFLWYFYFPPNCQLSQTKRIRITCPLSLSSHRWT